LIKHGAKPTATNAWNAAYAEADAIVVELLQSGGITVEAIEFVTHLQIVIM
jgi:hypothetical protein